MTLRNKLTVLGTSLLLIAPFLTVSVQAAQAAPLRESTVTNSIPLNIVAKTDATLAFTRSSISSTPAPNVEAPVVAVQYTQPEATPTATKTTPVAKKIETTPTPVPVTQAPPVASGKGSIIAAAALSQIGIAQDCTALVSKSLAAAGINFHGWPAGYMSLGTVTANPVPGDLAYYSNAGAGVPHIAVYIGNGQAVHGGFNGSTVVASAYLGAGPVFIHV